MAIDFAICVKLSFDSLFHLDDCIVYKGEKVLAQRWFLQEGKDFGVVATFDVVNTLLLLKRALLSNHFFVPFVLSIHSSRGRLRNQVLWFDL